MIVSFESIGFEPLLCIITHISFMRNIREHKVWKYKMKYIHFSWKEIDSVLKSRNKFFERSKKLQLRIPYSYGIFIDYFSKSLTTDFVAQMIPHVMKSIIEKPFQSKEFLLKLLDSSCLLAESDDAKEATAPLLILSLIQCSTREAYTWR